MPDLTPFSDAQQKGEVEVIRVAVVGLGKMGLSHLSMIRAHPQVDVVAVCDASGYILSVLNKYTGVTTFTDYDQMLAETELDAVLIATPSSSHAKLVRTALDRGLHVFCEKPFCLTTAEAEMLSDYAESKQLVTQVGYHNRFVGAFQEVKALLDAGAIGEVTHILGDAYGPVVLKPKGGTWRSQRAEGGGCLYDYAAHPINLINWYLGEPIGVGGTVLNKIFSKEIDDEVFSTLYFDGGKTAQVSVNWSDESQRKMTTRITVWGTAGRIYADRQECQVFLRDTAAVPAGYEVGWNVRYTTDLTAPVQFYVRGEEYSAQIDHFVDRVEQRRAAGINTFRSAAATDRVIALMVIDADKGAATTSEASAGAVVVVPVSPWPARIATARAGARAACISVAARGRVLGERLKQRVHEAKQNRSA
jgi:predicted dehydrogenase